MSCNTNAVCGTGGICSPSNSVSGRVTAIAVHPTDPNKIYVGTAQGGVYRSLDGGMSWTAISDGALSLAIGAVAIAPSNPTTVFVGTGEANFSQDSYSGVGIYRIDDAETTATLSRGLVSAIAMAARRPAPPPPTRTTSCEGFTIDLGKRSKDRYDEGS